MINRSRFIHLVVYLLLQLWLQFFAEWKPSPMMLWLIMNRMPEDSETILIELSVA